ncbi:cupin domain-containing protein [Pseudovibrio sp. SPO723]|uniref:cupin domain-containing protein n=1 Tax=Nesiotobacter zosterae TaxID=392721 RepID=UPI0029C47AB0|nr:cupin domain-containing protein [Pseudovibrio sp. SPO723]MDX5592870.1 cupin domain-containing protein [Pseudovibrio sp. SPO723]
MKINADFSQRVTIDTTKMNWVTSPMAGVERRMLDRIGDEVARATTIVRYAPGSHFSAHTHDGGEEFLVLEGVFQDEHGDFTAGTYVRNPPTSRHTPGSEFGCTILVKLNQFDPEDRTHVRIATQNLKPVCAADRPGVSIMPLYHDARETVQMEDWAPNTVATQHCAGGLEGYVLDGSIEESGELLTTGTWFRLPDGAVFKAKSQSQGARLWIKSGHLKGL